MKWPWRRPPAPETPDVENPDLKRARERLANVEPRADRASAQIIERGRINHFSESWLRMVEEGGTRG